MSAPAQRLQYKYYEFVMAAFVVILVCSNLIGPAKISQAELPVLGAVTFGAGVLFFPISYVFGDILTEVYGYARSRRVIWAGFAGLAFASFMAWVVVSLPPARGCARSPALVHHAVRQGSDPVPALAVAWIVRFSVFTADPLPSSLTASAGAQRLRTVGGRHETR